MRNLPILYKPTETEFGHMGEGILRDAISCIVTENQNGEYELELKYPINGIRSELLNYDMIIKAKANEEFDSQLFRIYSIRQDLNHNKVIRARHIFYDLLDNFIEKLSLNNTTCTQAGIALLNACTYPTPFTFEVSDITHTGNFNIERVNPVQAIAGVDGSIVDTFGNGVTIIRNNFKIGVKQNKTPISDVLIAYRKNLTGFERTVDTSNVATKIYPFAIVESQNGEESTKTVITLTEKYISNPYVDNYANPKIIPYDFSGNDVTTEDQLRAKARAYFTDDRGLPDINYEISFVPLNKTVEYSNFQLLETVTIGTDVTVFDERFNLRISTKVIKTVYDSLAGRYTSIELGKQKTNLATSKIESEQKLENKINNSNSSIENMNKLLADAIKNATDQITGADGGYVRLNPKDDPQEILIMDHPDINQAKNIWRFNKNGLGHSSTGYNGEYGLAITADGQIVADKITTGSLNAGLIKIGILMSANRNTWINMDTGTFNFGDKITFDGNNLTIKLQNGETLEQGISSINEKIKTNSSSITQLEDRIELKVEATDVTEAINNIQVGGRNLLKSIARKGTINTSVIDNGIKIDMTTSRDTYFYIDLYNEVTLGETLTLSFDVSGLEGTLTMGIISQYKNIIELVNGRVYKTFVVDSELVGDRYKGKTILIDDLVRGTSSNDIRLTNFKLEKGNKATDYTVAPEDVDLAITNVDSKVTTTNNKVASIETNLNGITQRVSSTESTVSTHTTQLGTVDSRISTAKNSAISTASSDATSKANNAQTNAINSAKSYTDGQITTVNKTITDKVAEIKLTTDSITQRVSSTETKLSSVTTTANSALSTANSANSKVDNLQVGGRNLLKKTSFTDNSRGDILEYGISLTFSDDVYIKGTKSLLGSYNKGTGSGELNKGFRLDISNLEQNENYIFSFYGKGWDDNKNINAYAPSVSVTLIDTISLSNNWKRYVFLIIPKGGNNIWIRPNGNINYNCNIILNAPKLEKGNKATDWTPAPGDIDSAISTVDTKITTTNNKVASIETNLNSITQRVSSTESNINTINGNITNLTSRMNSAEQKITPNAIVSTVQSTINTAKTEAINSANSATDTKLKNYATTSSLTQTSDSIIAKFEASGGYNLLKNSDARNGTNYWLNNGGGISVATAGGAPFVGEKEFATTFPAGATYYQSIKLKSDTDYVFEGWVSCSSALGNNPIEPLHFWCSSTSDTSGQSQCIVLDYRQNVTANKYTKVYVHFRTKSGNVYFKPFIYASNAPQGAKCWFKQLSLSEASLESAWTPHPDEVYSGSTIIDASGVTINNGALTVRNNAGTTVLSGDSNGNLTFTGTAKSQSGSQWVGLDAGGVTFQDWNRNEQMLRIGLAYFDSNRDMNGINFAMPRYSDYLRFSHIVKDDLTGGWSSSDTQYRFMDFWSGTYTVGGIAYKKGVNVYAPMYVNNGIFMKSGTNHTSDIKGDITWNTINGLLGLTGDNGCFVGYKSGDSLQARMVLTEGAHPGTGDNIISWGHYNFNGYTFHNAKVNALSLSVSGSKNCLQKTENYGNRLINAYETAEYYFGDLGFGRINPDGECLVSIDDIFQECVNTKIDYHVFTQCYNGSIESIEKYETYFIVKGKPKTEFSWELKAKRINYENNRLDTEEIAQTFISDYESEIDTYKVDTSEDALLGDIMFDLELILMGE